MTNPQEMMEPKEIVNMVATIGFFVYFYLLVRNGRCNLIPQIWLYGIFLITLSNIATVAEDVAFHKFFDFLEHITFTCACLFFLIGALFLKPEANS